MEFAISYCLSVPACIPLFLEGFIVRSTGLAEQGRIFLCFCLAYEWRGCHCEVVSRMDDFYPYTTMCLILLQGAMMVMEWLQGLWLLSRNGIYLLLGFCAGACSCCLLWWAYGLLHSSCRLCREV
jgi:hypothetical protein